ncbi:MAG: hypothetical protein AAB401_21115 [Acidobacteriota bacterium]
MTPQSTSAASTTSAQTRQTSAVSALAIEANFDPITKAAFKYRRKHIYRYLKKKGVKVVLLCGKEAVRRRVRAEATQANITYIIGVGHGRDRSFRGYRNQPVFRIGGYAAEEVRGKVVHLLSCFTASNLGMDFLSQGCRAFFGYQEEFAIPASNLKELNELAEAFFGSDGEIDLAFADGVPVEQILDRVRRKFDQHIAMLDRQGQRESSATLESNRDLLIGLFASS